VEELRRERLARNEALFREVNERVSELAEGFIATEGRSLLEFVCECGQADCTQPLELTREEYESVRADPRRFLVAAGHVIPDIESVVEQREGYTVVKKRDGSPAEIAIATDPRD
jgi:hypothetical protein